jgi:hypothetical protein
VSKINKWNLVCEWILVDSTWLVVWLIDSCISVIKKKNQSWNLRNALCMTSWFVVFSYKGKLLCQKEFNIHKNQSFLSSVVPFWAILKFNKINWTYCNSQTYALYCVKSLKQRNTCFSISLLLLLCIFLNISPHIICLKCLRNITSILSYVGCYSNWCLTRNLSNTNIATVLCTDITVIFLYNTENRCSVVTQPCCICTFLRMY